LASNGAALAAIFAVFLTACPGTGGDDPVCGNGVVEVGESCDDGNTLDGDGCSATCAKEGVCGNGILEPGEECDDENFQPGDGCDAECNVETGCGNGFLDVGEGCDDDNRVSGDGCSATCVDEEPGSACGNGIWEIGEGCEDGNIDDGDGCSATCEREDGCGDGVLTSPEQCDDGNNVSGDGCMYDCRMEFVPNDGICDVDNNETCEYSPADCCPECGNFVLDPGEGCDDGNNVSGDGCSQGCTDEVPGAECGNSIVEIGETCDDGNTDPADGCDASCQAEFVCGDGFCDTANHETCVLCQEDCCPDCNGGSMGPGEQCDGNDFGGITCEDFCYTGGTLTCTAACQIDTSTCTGTLPTCGDDSAGCDEECDGSDLRSQTCQTLGFESGTLACGSGCTFDTSGCQDRLWYLSEGFEGGLPVNWSTHGMWEIGTPASVGPAAAHDGANCAGTRIGANYDDNGTFAFDWLETPRVDLTNATVPVLLFYAWFSSESQMDGGNLRISSDGGVSFVPIPLTNVQPAYNHDNVGGEDAWTGAFASSGWRPVVVNLTPWTGGEVILRFAFYSDAATGDAGWYVDDVLIAEAEDIPVQITNNDPLATAVTGYAYDVQMNALGGSGSYDWSIVGGTNHTWLSIDSGTGLLSGTPDASDVGAVTVTVRVEDTANASNFDEQTFHLDVLNAVWFEDFEGSAAPTGWTGLGGALPIYEWGAPSMVGPPACNGGASCIGTVLGGTFDPLTSFCISPGACAVITPDIDLSGTTAPVLTYWQWVEFGGPNDGGILRVTDTIASQTYDVVPVPAYNGTAGGMMGIGGEPGYVGDMSGSGWHLVTVDLTAYVGTTINITFDFASDFMTSAPGAGWYLDDMMIAD
jgi:cysteine-rich repeat protein